MEEGLYYLWFAESVNIPKRIKQGLAEYYGSIKEIFEAPEEELRALCGAVHADKILAERCEEKIKAYDNLLKIRQIGYTYPGHEDYPVSLMNIPDKPEILYYKGDIKPLNDRNMTRLAVVGARKVTSYGMQMVDYLLSGLDGYDVQIISGLAYGVDACAHKFALSHNMYTVGVLGCGADVVYPAANAPIYRKINEQGAVISEYRPGTKPDNWRFPIRNRIISGLADAVLIVEAKEKSGSLITADQALEQGRDVLAVPGRVNDINSRGTNLLIKQGATIVTGVDDIVDALELWGKSRKENANICSHDFNQVKMTLAPEEKKVYSCVRLEPGHIDEICEASGLCVSETLKILYELEAKGLIYEPEVNFFSRKEKTWQKIL